MKYLIVLMAILIAWALIWAFIRGADERTDKTNPRNDQ